MMLGRELPMPSHILVATLEIGENKKSIHQYVQTLEKNLQETHQWAQEHLDRKQRHQKKHYYKKAQANKLEKGELVWLFNPTKKVGRSPKLQVKWEKEPFRVLDTISDMVIRIERLDGKESRVVQRNQIKKVENAQKYLNTV